MEYFIDKFRDVSSVRVSLHHIQMENKLKRTGKGLGVIGALAATVAHGADTEQLKAKLEQQLAEAPEAVAKVLASGEGCDVSLLQKALETGNHDNWMFCANIEKLKAEVELAQTEQALAEKEKAIAELTQEQESKLARREQDKTTMAALAKRGKAAEA